MAVLSRCWPYLRGALITLALFSQCVSALPNKALTEDKLERPESRRALRWLAVVLRPLGIDEHAYVLEQSRHLVAVRRDLLRPVAPLLAAAGMQQQWHLFLTATDNVYRLRVDASLPDGAWTTIYRTDHEDVLGLAPLLEYRRVRSTYNPGRTGARPQYEAFARWLMARIWKAQPAYAALRVGMEHLEVGGPERAPELLGMDFVIEAGRLGPL